MMSAAPLMHGAAQWACFTAFTNGNTVTMPAETRSLDSADVWERGVALAAEWAPREKLRYAEVLLPGSGCLVAGAIASFVLRRMHMITLIGVALYVAAMLANNLVPAIQFGVYASCVLIELVSSVEARKAEQQPAAGAPKEKQG